MALRETSSGALYENEDDTSVRLAIEIRMGRENPAPAERALDRHCMELLEKNATGSHDEDPIPMVQELEDEPKTRSANENCISWKRSAYQSRCQK